MTIPIGSVSSTAASLLSTLTGTATAQPDGTAPASASPPSAAHHGGHHGHHGGGAFSDILAALTDPTSTDPTLTAIVQPTSNGTLA